MIRIGESYISENEIAAVYPDKSEGNRIWVVLKSGRGFYCDADMLQAARALSDAGLLYLADVEPRDMELIVLENLADSGFLYIARDENGALFAYKEIPTRGDTTWISAAQSTPVPEPAFLGRVSWVDSEPAAVRLLLREARAGRRRFV